MFPMFHLRYLRARRIPTSATLAVVQSKPCCRTSSSPSAHRSVMIRPSWIATFQPWGGRKFLDFHQEATLSDHQTFIGKRWPKDLQFASHLPWISSRSFPERIPIYSLYVLSTQRFFTMQLRHKSTHSTTLNAYAKHSPTSIHKQLSRLRDKIHLVICGYHDIAWPGIGLWPLNGLKASWDTASFLATAPNAFGLQQLPHTATANKLYAEIYVPVKIPRFFCHLGGGKWNGLSGFQPRKAHTRPMI